MHFIVLGAGAIGCYVGGRLAAAGQSVTLVGRPSVLDPIRRDGLTVTDLEGFSAVVPAKDLHPTESLAGVDWRPDSVVLLCVKGGATATAAQSLAQACPAGTPVISLQNGVDNVARIAERAPHLQALAAMVPYNVVLRGARVHRATAGTIQLELHAATERVAQALQQAGVDASRPADIRAVQWGKLLLNLNNPVNALSNLPLREELLDRDCRMVLAALQTEALGVMARAGIRPAQVATLPPAWMPRVLRLPNVLFTRLAKRMLAMDATARSSMWDDLEAGRRTEIDDLCGAVVRLAAEQDQQAPLNAKMCALLQGPRLRLTGAQLRRTLGV